MIERILRMQTIDGPYLGKASRAANVAPQPMPKAMITATAPIAPEPLKLQSLGHQLHIQTAQKQVKQQQVHMQRGIQNIAQQTLQPATLQTIKNNGIHSLLSLSPQELLLLAALRAKRGPSSISDQWVPNTSAQLSFIDTPRRFLKTLPKGKNLRLRGLSFLRFRFDWELEEPKTTEEEKSANMLE